MNISDMKFNEYIELLEYDCFLIFEQFVYRIDKQDILLSGQDVVAFMQDLIYTVEKNKGLKYQVLFNKLFKLEQMIQRLYMYNEDTLVLTKFMSKYWNKNKRYSEYGEKLINLNTFLGIRPEYIDKLDEAVTDRISKIDDEDEDENREENKDELEDINKKE